MKELKFLVIHCTATPEGRAVSSADIRRWHLSPKPEGRGWRQVGYTDMIHLNGNLERLANNNDDAIVDPWEITNGVAGINQVSRHIVHVGGLDKSGKSKDTRTIAQRAALGKYVIDFIKKHPRVKVAGHNQFDKKDCPSFSVPEFLRNIGVSEVNIYTP